MADFIKALLCFLTKSQSDRTICFLWFHGCYFVFSPGCYLSFPANKLVSGEHCKIVQDESSGQVWLEDMRYRILKIHQSEAAITTAAHNWNILSPFDSCKNSWCDDNANLALCKDSSVCVCVCVCSTNGTVINMSKLVKKQTHMLQTGDVIYFVYRKSEPEQSKLSFFFVHLLKSPKGPVCMVYFSAIWGLRNHSENK